LARKGYFPQWQTRNSAPDSLLAAVVRCQSWTGWVSSQWFDVARASSSSL